MSTSSTITNDIYKTFINPKATDKQIVIMSKSLIIIAGFCSLLTALYSPLLLNLMLKGYQFNSAMFWPVILGLFWKKATAKAGFWSLLVGGIGSVIWNLIGSPFGWPSIYLAFPLTLIMMVSISLSSKHAAEENIISADSANENVASM
jgi:Na+/proline symporter